MENIKIIEGNNRAIAKVENIQVGECVYIEDDNVWNIVHTVVDKNYQGKGIARKLVEYIINKAQDNKKKLIADCSYAKRVLENK